MHILWDIRVVLDLFLGGIGIGAFILGAMLFFLDQDKYKKAYKVGFILSPIFVAVGLLFLLSEIGRPLHGVKMLFFINPSSVMSWGGILQAIFMIVSLFVAYKVVIKDEAIQKGVMIVGIGLASIIGIYHGALLSSFGREAWNSALPILFLATSVYSGFLLTLLVTKMVKKDLVQSSVISTSIIIFAGISLASTLGWVYGLSAQSATGKEALAYLFSNYTLLFFIAIIFGMLVPLFLYLKSFISKKDLSSGEFSLTAVSAIVGVFALKYVVVYLGQLEFLVK